MRRRFSTLSRQLCFVLIHICIASECCIPIQVMQEYIAGIPMVFPVEAQANQKSPGSILFTVWYVLANLDAFDRMRHCDQPTKQFVVN